VTPTPQALILAAGKGTRMKSTKAKVLHEALGLPLLGHVLRAVEGLGADPVGVVVGHQAEEVEAAFRGRGVFIRQAPQMGTGHAVQVARAHVGRHPERPLLVLNGDVPLLRPSTLRRLLDRHGNTGADATLLTAHLEDPPPYGRVVREQGRVSRIIEARDASPGELAIKEVNVGVYVFAVAPLLEALERLAPQNDQGEYYLTDAVGHLTSGGFTVETLATDDEAESRGVNTLAELASVTRILRGRRALELMAAGVVLEDPESTVIGLDVRVDPDAVIRPFTILEGKTHVACDAQIGPFARLVDVEVGRGAHVLDHCFLRECRVGEEASIGPFTHLRPESVIGPRARVGNFVELKKTVLGEGSKAPHLSYLGDASIGPKVNVGAGTITCNYDGVHKHPTRIEAGAFIGSDSVLVAPVSVGEGAYVAAGSTITEDVPADALALGRARQVVKPGWAAARRDRERETGGKTRKA
jgi:bifunctional UDP-N-acetylglucosamine pyrophosphorylase/glucosamine-1-phosphate N-acetyltransferase